MTAYEFDGNLNRDPNSIPKYTISRVPHRLICELHCAYTSGLLGRAPPVRRLHTYISCDVSWEGLLCTQPLQYMALRLPWALLPRWERVWVELLELPLEVI